MTALLLPAMVLRYVLLRIVPAMVGTVALCFLLLRLLPGDAADVLSAEAGSATAETLAALRERLGLDQPLIEQFLSYVGHLIRFDLGYSAKFTMPVSELVLARLPNTLLLLLSALGFALASGIALGWVMSAYANRWPDRLLSVLVLVFYSLPGFWIGLMAIVLFSVKLGWLPSAGSATVGAQLGGAAFVIDRLQHLVMPSAAMALFFVAVYARLARASMLEVLQQDYMRTARAKGLTPIRRQYRHALRNALIPVTTIAGIHLGNLLGGAVVVETVFGWPGLGQLAVDAVMSRDHNVLMAILLLSSVMVILINSLVDLLHSWLDPRVTMR